MTDAEYAKHWLKLLGEATEDCGRLLQLLIKERERSARLAKELQYIVDRDWTAKPANEIAWKWINDFVTGARRALAEYRGKDE